MTSDARENVVGVYVGPDRRSSSDDERAAWEAEHGGQQGMLSNGGKSPTLNIEANKLASSILLAAILAASAFVWSELRRIPTADTLKQYSEAVTDVQRLKTENAITSMQVRAIDLKLTEVLDEVKDIGRALRRGGEVRQ